MIISKVIQPEFVTNESLVNIRSRHESLSPYLVPLIYRPKVIGVDDLVHDQDSTSKLPAVTSSYHKLPVDINPALVLDVKDAPDELLLWIPCCVISKECNVHN